MRLVLFFTRGAGLGVWESTGMLGREVALYHRLHEHGVEVTFVTYGQDDRATYGSRLPGIRILDNRWRLPVGVYAHALPILHGRWLRQADCLKSNQTNGAEIALRAARLWRKPLVARSGFMWSEFAARAEGAASRAAVRARRMEARVFGAAARVVVTTDAMRDEVIRRVPAAGPRTVVIPNYVDTARFRPPDGSPEADGLVFVGRLTAQKNVESLLEAVRPLDCRLSLIGQGERGEALARRFADLGPRVRWCGPVPNDALPAHLARAALFVLPSHYEGHPKALLEAMACGVAVLGADSPGIRELIRHGETGWLCGTDPESLRQAIGELLADPERRARLGRNARRAVEQGCALDRVVERELALYHDLGQDLGRALGGPLGRDRGEREPRC